MKKIFSIPANNRRDSFEKLIHPHLDQLYRVAFRFCGTREDAEDLVQDLVIKLFPKFDELATIEQLRPWLTRAMYNLFVDNTRRYRRSPVMVHEDDPSVEIPDSGNTPDQEYDRARKLDQLQRMFDQLSDEHRNILALHDMEGYNLPELTTIMDVPLGTLKSRLHRAREKMRDLIKKNGTF